MRWLGRIAVLATLLGTGCGARSELATSGGSGGNVTGSTGNGNGAGGVGGGGPDAGATSFTSTQVQAALANCNLPHGPALSVTTVDEENEDLIGAWALCPSSADAGAMTLLDPGIAIGADGSFETLAADGAGGLQPGMGVTSQGQWSTFCETSSCITGSEPCSAVVVRLQTVGGDMSAAGCFGGAISFESGPRRMFAVDELQEWCSAADPGGEIDLWLVPLP